MRLGQYQRNPPVWAGNLSSYKGARVRELTETADAKLGFQPPYSPDRNPIDGAFSKIKQKLRSLE